MSLIPLSRNYLKAMLLVAAKADVRYYLEGIYFVGGEGKVLAYATDGRQMARWIVCEDYNGEDFEYIINRRAIKDAIKTKYNIHLNTENGEVMCAKNEDFRIFKGLVDAVYPNCKKAISVWVEAIKEPSSDDILLDGNYLGNLSKFSHYIAKHYKVKQPPVRLYRPHSASGSSNCNIFTINGTKDIIYIIASLHSIGITDEEHHAVLMDDHPIEKTETQLAIDNGFNALCGCSNKTPQLAKSAVDCRRAVIVDYDDSSYMDEHGNMWRFVHFIRGLDAVEDKQVTA